MVEKTAAALKASLEQLPSWQGLSRAFGKSDPSVESRRRGLVLTSSQLAVPPVEDHADPSDFPRYPAASTMAVSIEPLDDLLPA